MAVEPYPFDKRFLDLIDVYHDDAYPTADSFGALLRAVVPLFELLGIEYAFTDSIAIRLHGAIPLYQGLNVQGRMTPASWEMLRSLDGTSLNIREAGTNRVALSTERYQAGFDLDASAAIERERIYGVWVVTLPWLISVQMRYRSAECRDNVVRLIQANHLDCEFDVHLPVGYRSRFRRLVNRAKSQPADS